MITRYYWDVESGGTDLDERSQDRRVAEVRRSRHPPRRRHGRAARRRSRPAAPRSRR